MLAHLRWCSQDPISSSLRLYAEPVAHRNLRWVFDVVVVVPIGLYTVAGESARQKDAWANVANLSVSVARLAPVRTTVGEAIICYRVELINFGELREGESWELSLKEGI